MLIYIDTYDLICKWIGDERWTLKMPWTRQVEAFVNMPLRDWEIDGHVVGGVGCSFATVPEAGHMVNPPLSQDTVLIGVRFRSIVPTRRWRQYRGG